MLHRAAFVASLLLAGLALSGASPAPKHSPAPWHVVHRYSLGGAGGWDYLSYEPHGHRLFLGRGSRVLVVDTDTGKRLGEVTGLHRAHGAVFDEKDGRGFATSGGDAKLAVFDLSTLKVLGRVPTGKDDDASLFDPATRKVFTFDADDSTSTVVDPKAMKRIATIPLGGQPEFAVSAGDGKLYVNLVDKAEIAEIDAKAMKVVRHWSIAPCRIPTGLAIDRAHHRLFSACRNRKLVVSDDARGRVVASVPICAGTDGARFDPGLGDAFATCHDGHLTVVHEVTPDRYRVAQTVTTMDGARTIAIDTKGHRVFTVSARFGKLLPARPGHRYRRHAIVPGSFTLLVVAR